MMPTYGFSGTSSGSEQDEPIAQLVKEEFSKTKDVEVALNNVMQRLGEANKIMVFFGFQGILANVYSLVEKGDMEEIKIKCFALDDSVSPTFHSIPDFYKFQEKYDKPEDTFKPMKVEDAMQSLRLGEKLNRKDQVFIDSEVDEFDENCNDDCIPGKHTCGK